MTIQYTFDFVGDDATWTITDSLGRVHTATFPRQLPTSFPQSSVVNLRVATADGQVDYKLAYATKAVARRDYDCSAPGGEYNSDAALVAVLATVTLPNHDQFSIMRDGVAQYDDSGRGTGQINGLQLPTRGWLQWTYGYVAFPTDSIHAQLVRQVDEACFIAQRPSE